MKPYKRPELIVVLATLLGIAIVSYSNLQASYRRTRDAQRRSDIRSLSGDLARYKDDFGFVPLASEDGRILGCEPENNEEMLHQLKREEIELFDYLEALIPCEWGEDGLTDLSDPGYPPYRERLPIDPKSAEGYSYRYVSNGTHYQLFSTLEGEDSEEGYDEGIVARGLMCGDFVCSFGSGYDKTPLDITLEEYEEQLRIELEKLQEKENE